MRKILVIAAHPDDELLGVGGTIRRLTNEGKEVRALILAEGITSRANTRNEADFSELEELRMTCDRIAIVSGGKISGILPASASSEDFGALMVSNVK